MTAKQVVLLLLYATLYRDSRIRKVKVSWLKYLSKKDIKPIEKAVKTVNINSVIHSLKKKLQLWQLSSKTSMHFEIFGKCRTFAQKIRNCNIAI